MKDKSHSFLEAAVLGQLRDQKPSALLERSSHGYWLEEEAGDPKLTSLCERSVSGKAKQRIRSQETIISAEVTHETES